ncbi:MAG: hypothetical protein ACRDT2_12140 [Natronosporangium sp.]
MATYPPDDDSLLAARAAKERYGAWLMANPDVHGVGVGRRRRANEKTDEYAVVIHLGRKLPEHEVPSPRRVPRQLSVIMPDGREVIVAVDVQEKDRPSAENEPSAELTLADRIRPVPGGVSAGRSGTLGGWVWDTVTNQVVALSNKHVFGSTAGRFILQPSRNDGGSSTHDRIATVLRSGSLDAAIAAPIDPGMVARTIPGAGAAVFAINDATIDMRVQKTGRGTGLTRGIVDLIDYDSDHGGSHSDLWIEGDGGDFSNSGDSGALYLEVGAASGASGRKRAVGLHWGGSLNDGVGHHIRAVFNDLGLTVLPPPGVP